MKLLIASDIHGYSKYVEFLKIKVETDKIDRVILLGDYLSYGYNREEVDEDTKKTIRILNEMKSKIYIAMMGNGDSQKTKEALDFELIEEYKMIYLDGKKVMLTHGHQYHENNIEYMSNKPDILIHGHTHIPRILEYPEYISLNPGSISIPRAGSRNSYMLYEDRTFCIEDMDGNLIKEIKI